VETASFEVGAAISAATTANPSKVCMTVSLPGQHHALGHREAPGRSPAQGLPLCRAFKLLCHQLAAPPIFENSLMLIVEPLA
jgi:hypothetical protein